MSYSLLPFKFERLGNGEVLISNDAGFYHLFDSEKGMLDFMDGECIHDMSILKGKLFCYETQDEKEVYVNLTASSVSYRYQSNLCSPFLFMIVPTLRCDHDCSYCQVSRVSEDAAGYDLDINMIPSIIDKIKRYGSSPYKIEFQGGEPLLNFAFVKLFVEEFEFNKDGCDAEYVIATSLSLITDEIVEWAKDLAVTFSVSIDGTDLIHDSQRRHYLASSHGMMVDGVRSITENLGFNRLGTVTTITKHALSHPVDIVEAHKNLGLVDLFVRPLSPYGFATVKYETGYTASEFNVYYEKLLRYMVENYDELGMVEHNAALHLKKIFNPKFNGYVDLKSPTGHFMGALIFDYTGNVFGSDESRMLYKSFGIESLSLGRCYSELNVDKNEALNNILSSSFISEMPGCDECAYQPYCGVDTMHHLATQGDLVGDKSISRFCQYQKGLFDILFRMLNEQSCFDVFERWVNE